MAGLPTLAPGMLFARDFQVLGLLAEGGMGAVYVVEQVSTGKRRALKIMLPALVEDRRARERFAMEARIGSQIESEHIVEVVAAGIDDATETPWLAMEMLEGQDLHHLLRARGRLSVDETIEVLQQLGEGLGPAHARGIVHRDLKPENLFIAVSRRRGVPFTLKILDFGIAKLTQESRATASATAAIGSPMWMSPEQTEQAAQLRPATDVWAIGLIAFHMLTGRYYWRVANEPDVRLTALFTEVLVTPLDPPTVRAAQAGIAHLVPPGFDVWFSRCVARAPEQRFPDAAAAINAIGPGFTYRDPTGPVSLPQPTDSRRGGVAATMPMQAVSRTPPPKSGPYTPAPAAQGQTPMPSQPYGAVASRPASPYATGTPYSVQAGTTSTGGVNRPSGGTGRMVALVAGLFLLGAGGAAATLGGLVLYERYQNDHIAGGGTEVPVTTVAVDAGPPAVDADVPHGEDPTDPTDGTDGLADGSDTSDSTDATDTPPATTLHSHRHPRGTPDPTTDGTGDVTDVTDATDATDDSADPSGGDGYAWDDGTNAAFNGTYSQGGYRYAMTFSLVRSGSGVTGSIFVVCESAPADHASLVGRSAMEWVGGSYASSGALTLTGRSSTDTNVWTTGTYHLFVASSGALSGRSTDGGRITGHS